jgi:hypothetical protein
MYFGPFFSLPVEILGVRRAGISTGFSNFFANLGGFAITYFLDGLKIVPGCSGTVFISSQGSVLSD